VAARRRVDWAKQRGARESAESLQGQTIGAVVVSTLQRLPCLASGTRWNWRPRYAEGGKCWPCWAGRTGDGPMGPTRISGSMCKVRLKIKMNLS
jgi:hypothetical protein